MKAPPTASLYEALEDRGLRLTGPRERLLHHLQDRNGSFTVEEVAAALPDVGRATVYRTIKLLVEAGVVCKTALPTGAPRYSLDHAHHHHHLVCVTCGRVQEFRHPAAERFVRGLRAAVPGRLVGHRIELYMTCDDCLAADGR